MGLAWTPDQRKIFDLLTEGLKNKDIVAATGFDRAFVSKVKRAKDEGDVPPPVGTKTPAPQKPKLTGEEGENILSVVAGYETEGVSLIFIFDPITRKVIEFRHKYPEAVPMYNKCQEEPINFKGSFDQWLFSMVRTLLKVLGWEYALAPRSQGLIYDDVVRLVDEGKIKLEFDETGNPKLEVINDNGRGEGKGGEGGGGEGEATGDASEPAKSGARATNSETHSRAAKRGKGKPTE